MNPITRGSSMIMVMLLAATTVAMSVLTVAGAAPMRGWMTWERYTCETDCTNFPVRTRSFARAPVHLASAHAMRAASCTWC